MQMLHRCQDIFEVRLVPAKHLKQANIKVLAEAILQAQHIQLLQANTLTNKPADDADQEEFTL
jgi:hypothetical protein